MAFSLTSALLKSDPVAFQAATESDFLARAAQGTLDPTKFGLWLAYDRLYIHQYRLGAGLLEKVVGRCLPNCSDDDKRECKPATDLHDWLATALSNLEREEGMFIETSRRCGFSLDPESYSETIAAIDDFKAIFSAISPSQDGNTLPWLEGAVVFWATEKCYLDAWSWAKSQRKEDPASSETGNLAVISQEFIPNWTNPEFVEFVKRLQIIIDTAVLAEIQRSILEPEDAQVHFIQRSIPIWKRVLEAERKFWPSVE